MTLLKDKLKGKKVSILGDSISTWKGITDNGKRNRTINSRYLARYAKLGDEDKTLVQFESENDTWWMQTINEYGMKLLVNNAWRGTKVRDTEVRAGYYSRCLNLHSNKGEEPDLIAVYMGKNDYLQSETPGALNENRADLITKEQDGTFSYLEPTTFAEAYEIMIDKILKRYTCANVFCFTIMPCGRIKNQKLMEDLNSVIRSVAKKYNLPLVDLYKDSGLTWDNTEVYLAKDLIHPNLDGADLITNCFNKALEDFYLK